MKSVPLWIPFAVLGVVGAAVCIVCFFASTEPVPQWVAPSLQMCSLCATAILVCVPIATAAFYLSKKQLLEDILTGLAETKEAACNLVQRSVDHQLGAADEDCKESRILIAYDYKEFQLARELAFKLLGESQQQALDRACRDIWEAINGDHGLISNKNNKLKHDSAHLTKIYDARNLLLGLLSDVRVQVITDQIKYWSHKRCQKTS